jgi:hypothetical protein
MSRAIPIPEMRPRSLVFRGQREIDWSKLEVELHAIAARVQAVEMIGRGAQDSVHGEPLGEVFSLIAQDISDNIERLKELLGLGWETRQ